MLLPAVLLLYSADLLYPASHGQTEQVKTMLSAGANVEIKDKRGRTPLLLAAQHGQVEIVKMLLENGANPGVRDRDGATAYTLALLEHRDAVLPLLPKPKPWRLAVDSTWTAETLFSSCYLVRDELPRFVRDMLLDDLALATFQSQVNTSGNDLIQIARDDNEVDAKLKIVVKPGDTCAQQAGDTLSLSLDAVLTRTSDQTTVVKATYGGGLKGLHVRGVANPSQFAMFYDGWIKTHSAKMYRDVLSGLLKSPR